MCQTSGTMHMTDMVKVDTVVFVSMGGGATHPLPLLQGSQIFRIVWGQHWIAKH